MTYFALDNVSIQFGGLKAVDGVSSMSERPDLHDHRPERRRQDDALQPHQPPLQRHERDRLQGRGDHATQRAADRRPRHRAHVPEHRIVRQRIRPAEPAGRPPSSFHDQLLAGPPVRAEGQARGVEHRRAVEEGHGIPAPAALPRHANRRTSLRRAQGRRSRPRAASAPKSSCWTNHRPASTSRKPTAWPSGSSRSTVGSASPSSWSSTTCRSSAACPIAWWRSTTDASWRRAPRRKCRAIPDVVAAYLGA